MGYCNSPTFSATAAEPTGESDPGEYRIFSHSSCLAVSASEGFNISQWVETLITALPDKASSGVTRQLDPVYRTEKVTTTAQEGFARVVGEIFDNSVEALLESHTLRAWLTRIRYRLISLAKLLWHRFF